MRANVRVIAATNRDLAREVDAKRFRRDLFHRLAVISLNLPPLRRRIEDMPHLLEHMLAKHAPSGGAIPPVDETTVAFLKRYSWPGNIRELENLVEAFYVLGDGDFATFVADRLAGMETTHELPSHAVALPAGRMEFATALKQVADTDLTLEAVRYLLAVEAMERSNNNKSQAARLLGCSFKSLDNWLRHK